MYIFVLFASPKTHTFVLLFYTFSYFIPTFPKVSPTFILLFYTRMPESLILAKILINKDGKCKISAILRNIFY